MQGHLFHMLRPLVSKHTHIRDALARIRAGNLQAFEDVLFMIEEVVKNGILEYEANPEKFESEQSATLQPIENGAQVDVDVDDDDTSATIARCRRPWWVCQPYIRPSPKEAYKKGSMTMSKQGKRRIEMEKGLDLGAENSHVTEGSVHEEVEMVEVAKEELVCG